MNFKTNWRIGFAAAGLSAWALVAAAAGGARAQDPDPTEIMKQAHLNQFYSGDDGISHVQMTITNKKGKTREREFIMLRRDLAEGGEQKYFAYFLRPSDVKRTAFMAWKNPQKDDSRWIYVPVLDLVKPISANDKKSSFVGSDFSYEDVSGRHWSEDNHVLIGSEDLNGRDSWVIESTPKNKDYFRKKITWVDKEWLLPMKEDFYDGKSEQPTRTYESIKVEEADGFMTVTSRRMTNHKKKNNTLVEFEAIDYNVGIDDDVFTERYLKSPPRKYLQ